MTISLRQYIQPNRSEKMICCSFWAHVKKLQACGVLSTNFIIFHIANEQYTSKNYTIQLKNMGLMAGVPDYCVLLPNGRVGFIEFKRNPKSKLTVKQQEFAEYCKKLNIPFYVAYDEVDGIDYITDMLKMLDQETWQY